MRLVQYRIGNGPQRLGALTRDGSSVVDLTEATQARLAREGVSVDGAVRLAGVLCPNDVVPFIEAAPLSTQVAQETLDAVERGGLGEGLSGEALPTPVAAITYLPAVPKPTVLRDFMCFEQHLQNIYPKLGRQIPPEWYEMPVYYKGNPNATGAHMGVVEIPEYAPELDLEMEIGIVIGRTGKNIPAGEALPYIFGYTIYNDVSARGIQMKEVAVGLGPAKGKDFDGAHVLGPCLVTADEIPDPYDLDISVDVNGVRWMNGSTSTITWRFEDMIAHASRGETIRPGEVFGSGTVGNGSGAERGEFLHAGDRVDLHVSRIGSLTTFIGERKD